MLATSAACKAVKSPSGYSITIVLFPVVGALGGASLETSHGGKSWKRGPLLNKHSSIVQPDGSRISRMVVSLVQAQVAYLGSTLLWKL